MPTINENLCNQCCACVDVCDNEIFALVQGKVQVVLGNCMSCMDCVEQCEAQAISFEN